MTINRVKSKLPVMVIFAHYSAQNYWSVFKGLMFSLVYRLAGPTNVTVHAMNIICVRQWYDAAWYKLLRLRAHKRETRVRTLREAYADE